MKKIYFAMAVLGTVLLSSCVQEKNFKDITMGENEIAFIMQGVSTRSAVEGSSPAVKGVTIPMTNLLGDAVYLEETIEELNPSPETKGAPAYTVNLPEVHKSLGVYAAGKFGDATFQQMDTEQYEVNGKEDGWRYNHEYPVYPWPDDKDEDVAFYLRMPATGGGVSSYDKTTFVLTSPENGEDQQDILFGQVSKSKNYHDSMYPGGIPVTMKHALTGIKFRNGHLNDTQTKTIITKVELVGKTALDGLKSKGNGSVGTDGTVTWTNVGTPSSFYLEFDNPTYDKTLTDPSENPDGTVTAWDSSLNGTTWVDAADDHNLNNDKGELTFWFIPQEVPDDLLLNIEFYVKTPDTPKGTKVPHTIELGKLLNDRFRDPDGDGTANKQGNLTWEAGQLRTYTLKPYDVDVEIEDTITATKKSNLHIANTGNVDEYVRLLIMGNWYGWKPGTTKDDTVGVAPSILIGYKYKDAADASAHQGGVNDMVPAWFRSGDNGADPYGAFDDSFTLASLGDRDGKRNDWAAASGGFYYTMPIGPGKGAGIGSDAASATKDLFKSYTVTNVPTIYLPVGGTREPAEFVHLVMEIVIQAIAVPQDANGNDVWWLQAWYDATGIEKLDPEASRNAKYKTFYTNGEYAATQQQSGN